MRAELWKALLRRIPEQLVDNLALKTANGPEVNVQAILRLDDDIVILRGRIAGSNDTGRIFLLPYEHFDHIAFQRPLSDEQLQEAFGIAPAPPAVPAVPEPSPTEAAPAPSAEPPPAATLSVAAPSPAPAAAVLARLPTKAEIIKRLRQRTEAREGGSPAPKQ
jgi:hypothetical protein